MANVVFLAQIWLIANPVHIRDFKIIKPESLVCEIRIDDHLVFIHVLGDYIIRHPATYAEPCPLPNGVENSSVVFANLFTILIYYLSLLGRDILLQKLTNPNLADKTYPLGIFFVCSWQAKLLGQISNFFLGRKIPY